MRECLPAAMRCPWRGAWRKMCRSHRAMRTQRYRRHPRTGCRRNRSSDSGRDCRRNYNAGQEAGKATSNGVGQYTMRGLAPGTYSVTATANGFAAFSMPGVVVTAGQMKTVNAAMQIVVQEQVQVEAEPNTVSTKPGQQCERRGDQGRGSERAFRRSRRAAKRIGGAGRPGRGAERRADLHRRIHRRATAAEVVDSRNSRQSESVFCANTTGWATDASRYSPSRAPARCTANFRRRETIRVQLAESPAGGGAEPPYYSWNLHGSVGGPITKTSSYFVSAFSRNQQNENIVEAINPASITAANPDGASINEAFGNPTSRLDISPRIDLQLGSANTLTIRETYNRSVSTDSIGGNWVGFAGAGDQQHEPGKHGADFRQLGVKQEPGRRHSFPVPQGARPDTAISESAFIHGAGSSFQTAAMPIKRRRTTKTTSSCRTIFRAWRARTR